MQKFKLNWLILMILEGLFYVRFVLTENLVRYGWKFTTILVLFESFILKAYVVLHLEIPYWVHFHKNLQSMWSFSEIASLCRLQRSYWSISCADTLIRKIRNNSLGSSIRKRIKTSSNPYEPSAENYVVRTIRARWFRTHLSRFKYFKRSPNLYLRVE